ncbi:MAG: OsmC family peroxiredoxin [Bacteroidetes bacterium]|nr:MAG: OsmC family peroxiredoxin [Bacteroidota bacterium]
MKTHQYETTITWTGNTGAGTADYKSYERAFSIAGKDKYAEILGSSDAVFRGDKTRYNPEDLLISALSSCHLLWYLHLCAVHGVMVMTYQDNVKGTMIETEDGGGKFSEVTLSPAITVGEASMIEKAYALHEEAHKKCFIANSCNFDIKIEPKIDFSRKSY